MLGSKHLSTQGLALFLCRTIGCPQSCLGWRKAKGPEKGNGKLVPGTQHRIHGRAGPGCKQDADPRRAAGSAASSSLPLHVKGEAQIQRERQAVFETAVSTPQILCEPKTHGAAPLFYCALERWALVELLQCALLSFPLGPQ